MMAELERPASRLFSPGRLTVGIVLPMRQASGPAVDFREQIALAARAEALGFGAIWVRDVPLNGPWYPEAFGHLDPMVMLGALAVSTREIVIGSAATVLTLRHPLHVAKAALSIDALSGGRFLLGLGSGDRPEEFAAFGHDGEDRRALYRARWEQLVPAIASPQQLAAPFEMRPASATGIDMLAIGGGGQTLEWVARNAIGWATYHRPPDQQKDRHAMWRRAVDQVAPGTFRSFSVATRIDLLPSPTAPAEAIDLGYRAGADAFAAVLEAMRDDGTHHVMLNLIPNGRPPAEVIEELSASVLPRLRG